jgi:hypothetical protein
MSRGIHTKPNDGLSVDWITPPEITACLGGWAKFALDPCCHREQVYRTAREMIAPPLDGLKARWKGRVWLNPPYGRQIATWLERLADHGKGIALVPARTEVESWFWPYIWERADAMLFLRGRLYFRKPNGSRCGNAGHGSVLAAYGESSVNLLKDSKIPGRFLRLIHSVTIK